MHSVIVSDTSILIVFSKINKLDILRKVYGALIVTPEVADEFSEQLPEWIKVEIAKDIDYQKFLETQVDIGEASSIALAKEIPNVLVLLDDLKARKLARILNLKFTGTLGIINKAKQLGVIDKIKPIIEKIINTDFRISDEIVAEILRINNE